MKRRQLFGTLALLLGPAQIVRGATILAVRVWPAEEYTRVTIESDAALAEKHFLAENPYRLVIDIDGLELSPALRELVGKVRPDDPFIQGVRPFLRQLDLADPAQRRLYEENRPPWVR